MPEPVLSAEDIRSMSTPFWEQAKEAVVAGDQEKALEMIDRAVEQWRSLQDYSINWITQLLSFVGSELGEEAVERSLRDLGEKFLKPRRTGAVPWAGLPAGLRAKIIARAMVANFGAVEVSEDDEKVTMSFRCGSGGRMIDEGKYEGPASYLTLREKSGRTFMRDELPVYCAHCSVNNEMQPVEWGGVPSSIEFPPTSKGEPCVHHVYKDGHRIPAEALRRIGDPKATSPAPDEQDDPG